MTVVSDQQTVDDLRDSSSGRQLVADERAHQPSAGLPPIAKDI
jgi:hypothetical protein